MPTAKPNQREVLKMPGLTKPGDSKTLPQLYQALPGLKLLLIVKNPIKRIISHIMHEYVNPGGLFAGQEMPDINDIVMDRVPSLEGPTDFDGLFYLI